MTLAFILAVDNSANKIYRFQFPGAQWQQRQKISSVLTDGGQQCGKNIGYLKRENISGRS